MSGLKRFGVVTSALLAAAATFVLGDFLLYSALGDWFGYPALGFVVVAGAWSASAAWAADRRLLAIPGHIATLFAPWGFLYFVPLLAVILAVLAGATFKTSKQTGPTSRVGSREAPSV